ncbi:MAG: hypothetical protein ACFE95_02955 [Candidatus Hodarchaeota archaeon]
MIEIPKIQVDVSKRPVGVLKLLTEREFILFFILTSCLISIVTGMIGLIFSMSGTQPFLEEGLSSIEIAVIFFGYANCIVFALFAVKKFFSEQISFSIHRSRTIVISLGIAFLIAAFIGSILIIIILTVIYPDYSRDNPAYEAIESSASFFAMPQLIGWLLGGFILIHLVLVNKIDFRKVYIWRRAQRFAPPRPPAPLSPPSPRAIRTEPGVFCMRCGKGLPPRARYCDICAYPVSIPQQEEISFKRVSFKHAVELLDSESYHRGTRMNIEFECMVQQPASPEQPGGPAPYRTIQVTDPGGVVTRTLYVWGDPGHRYNINLVASIKQGDRILVIGPRRPKDSPYYKDEAKQDVFWIERWDGTESDTGTRLLKLEDVSAMKVEEEPLVSEKGPEVIEKTTEYFSPEAKTVSPPFYCQLCSLKHPAGMPRMQCEACGRYLCVDSFADMAKVGRTACPMCDGKLITI